jgi:putative phage-type endonuclease
MKTHNLIQGSPEWHAHRAASWNASDAPAMMGCSPYKTRDQLLQDMATGISEEVTPELQRRFDDGHRFEALARPLAEKIIGEELAPMVGSCDVVIASRALSASFDGIDFMETVGFEHKSLNSDLIAAFDDIATVNPVHRERASGQILPLVYRVQMQQQIMVSGVERVLFMASKWEGESLIEERHCWYYPDEQLAEQIVAGWTLFAADLADWKPKANAAPAPTGRAPETLPALRIEVIGAVTASNLAEFKGTALAVFKGINRNLITDTDFADAEKTVKWCSDVEGRLKAAKEHALSQTETIDALFKAIDDISAEARQTRLDLEKLVKARKEEIRHEIVRAGRDAYDAHILALNQRLGKPLLASAHRNIPEPDFAGAIKGKRTVDSLQDAVNTTLAAAKIEASAIADRVQINLGTLRELAKDHAFLFADTQQIVLKAPEDLAMLVKARIADHQTAEAARLEAERERIRREEQARIEREQAQAQHEARQAEAKRIAAENDKAAAEITAEAAPSNAETATLKLGTICERLGFTMTAAFVADSLGIQPAATDNSAKLYRESDYQRIVQTLIVRLQRQLLEKAA